MNLIDRVPGDDVIVRVRMRRSSFEKLTSTVNGRSVPIDHGAIGLVADRPDHGGPVWTFVVWTAEPDGPDVPEPIPANQLSLDALKEARR